MNTGLEALMIIIVAVMAFAIVGGYYFVYSSASNSVSSSATVSKPIQKSSLQDNESSIQGNVSGHAPTITIVTGAVTLSGSHRTDTFNVTEQDFVIIPNVIMVGTGDTIVMHVKNIATDDLHDIYFEGLNVSTPMLSPGQNATITFNAPATPGNYSFYCTVPMHQEMGMTGTLVVATLAQEANSTT